MAVAGMVLGQPVQGRACWLVVYIEQIPEVGMVLAHLTVAVLGMAQEHLVVVELDIVVHQHILAVGAQDKVEEHLLKTDNS